MKRFILAVLLCTATLSCKKDSSSPSNSSSSNCGQYNGKQLYLGPQGGCYYINSSGNKEYVARNLCNC